MNNLTNLFEEILIDDIFSPNPNTTITIRNSKNPLILNLIAVVKCGGCKETYKKRLPSSFIVYFEKDIMFKCPNSSCTEQVSISYRKNF